MAGVSRSRDDTTRLCIGNRADVVMTELDGDEVAGLQVLIDGIPEPLFNKGTRRAPGMGSIVEGDL